MIPAPDLSVTIMMGTGRILRVCYAAENGPQESFLKVNGFLEPVLNSIVTATDMFGNSVSGPGFVTFLQVGSGANHVEVFLAEKFEFKGKKLLTVDEL